MLRKLQLWQRFDEAERAAVLALPHHVERFAPSKYIVRQGDQAKYSCLMLSGYSYRHKITGDGARSIIAVHMAGDMVDLQNSLLETADHSVQTLTQAEVALIPREQVIKLAFDYPKVGMAMWYDTLVDGSIFREWIANIARRDAAARLTHLLCEFGVRLQALGLGDRNSFELPMTQEQLADATGLTAVHVNRTLKELEAQALITRTHRYVAVGDWDRLEKAGDFDDSYLHLGRAESLLN
jgi:CRP-like cAMP-binding protein